jgi:hypothetical protein
MSAIADSSTLICLGRMNQAFNRQDRKDHSTREDEPYLLST